MLNKLGPIAVGLALAGTAHAQTAVVLYGIADGGVRVDHTAIGTLKSMESGGEAQTRWGIRGSEDLGGGLKAIFNFEQDFDLSDNSVDMGAITATTPTSPVSSSGSRVFARRAIVGLNSAQFGEIRFGRDTTPMFNVWTPADAFANGTTGRANNIAVGNVARFDNAISYDTPVFAGFQARAMVRLGESTTNSTATGSATKGGGEGDSFSLTYAQGPIYAGVGYVHQRSAIDQGPASNPVRSIDAGVAYDFGFMKLFGLYFHTRNQTTTKQTAYEISAAVPLGALRLLAAVARVDNKYDANGSTAHLNDANFVAVGASYAMSKRVDLYTSWSKFVNQGAAAFLVQDQGAANGLQTAANVPPGFNPWSAEVGVRFLF